MAKNYLDITVWDATQSRLEYLFSEFDKLLIAFSGGKDSTIVLNAAYDYATAHNLKHKLAFYHLDYEAQYQATTDFVAETFEKFSDIERFWLCLPLRAQCAVNSEDIGWIPWDPEKREIWVRDLPVGEYVLTEANVPFPFEKGRWDYDVQDDFVRWYSEKQKTAALIGIRADESLNRYRAIKSQNKVNQYADKDWITDSKAYPIYDWTTKDVWIAFGKFGWSYNRIYDLFYQAGLNIDQMRVASPFNDAAISSLKLYQAIEPDTWAKMVGRVKGVNFAGIYGGTTAMGWKSIQLPEGHTWKSYLKFLLSTLPEATRKNYEQKFRTSIEFWKNRGGVLSERTIQELEEAGIPFKIKGKTNYKTEKVAVTFDDYPDDAQVTEFQSVPTFKRMCITIMKNDHLCKYMGFSQTKAETERRKEAIEKYKNIL